MIWTKKNSQTQGFNPINFRSWSQLYGNVAGTPNEFVGLNYSLIAVRGKCGALIDSIQFLFSDIITGQLVQSPCFGGIGGGDFVFQAPIGQWIDHVYIDSSDWMIGLAFETNQGTRSNKFGGNSGKEVKNVHFSGKRITGVKVRSQAFVDGISFCTSS